MPYDPLRGGHAPGHLRDEFLHLLDEYFDGPAEEADEAAHNAEVVPKLHAISGTLWNCRDVTPGIVEYILDQVGWLETYRGGPTYSCSTYARAARLVRDNLALRHPDLIRKNAA